LIVALTIFVNEDNLDQVASESSTALFATCMVSVVLNNTSSGDHKVTKSDVVLATTICLVSCIANFGII
jgi:hypothetical protein